ncbi:MAG: DUF1292 domain-containing protein [Oscillospiraceae bacterium]|nr:DUF1292 domain-containing protein [Oscillospiraceae bacterium]
MGNENEIKTFTAVDSEGKEVEMEIIAAFVNDETDKQYIIFTDRTENAEGALNVSAASFVGDLDGEIKISKIETPEEWEIVNDFICDMNKEIED